MAARSHGALRSFLVARQRLQTATEAYEAAREREATTPLTPIAARTMAARVASSAAEERRRAEVAYFSACEIASIALAELEGLDLDAIDRGDFATALEASLRAEVAR